MSFSIPIFAALAAAALALLGALIYLIIYRAHINRALRSGGAKPMAAPRTALAVIAVVVFALAVFASYLAGYKAAYDDFEGASSPAVEIPPMTLRDLSALTELLDSALEHVERDGADLTNARAELTDLTFLNGGFSYLSFTLYYDAGGGRISRSVDVNGAGAVFTEWYPAKSGAPENSIPLDTLRRLFTALGSVNWPEGGDIETFNSLFGIVDAQSPGGYVLEGGSLVPSTDAEGKYLMLDYVSGSEWVPIYVPAE